MLAKGEHKVRYLKHRGHVPLLFKIGDEPVKIRRDEIKKYIDDPVFLTILAYYNWIKLWGMPYASGWADLPVDVLDGITAIETEARAIEAEQLEDHKSKNAPNVTDKAPKGIKRGNK